MASQLSESLPFEKTDLKGKLSLSCEAKIRGSQEGGGQGQEDPQFLTLMGRTADISRSLGKRGVDTIEENEEILEYIGEKQNIQGLLVWGSLSGKSRQQKEPVGKF